MLLLKTQTNPLLVDIKLCTFFVLCQNRLMRLSIPINNILNCYSSIRFYPVRARLMDSAGDKNILCPLHFVIASTVTNVLYLIFRKLV